MGFERYRRQDPQFRGTEPFVTINVDGGIRIDAVADAGWFDGVDTVGVLIDRDRGLLAFDPGVDDDDALTLSRRDDRNGAEVAVKPALTALGVDVEAVENLPVEDRRFHPELDDDAGLITVDCSGLPGVEPSDRDLGTKGDEADTEIPCDDPDCDRTFDTVRGKNIHAAKAHPDPQDDDEGDDEEESPLDEPCWCGRCGAGPMTEADVKEHTETAHDGEPIVWDVEPDADHLVGDGHAIEDDVELIEFSDWQADPGNGIECSNCGSHLTPDFTRVMEPDEEGNARCCPNCRDLVRDGNEVREARSPAGRKRDGGTRVVSR